MCSTVMTSDLAFTELARGAERGLLSSIESGAVLDRAFWLAFLGATWVALQCLPM
jgi:hypothetical protein